MTLWPAGPKVDLTCGRVASPRGAAPRGASWFSAICFAGIRAPSLLMTARNVVLGHRTDTPPSTVTSVARVSAEQDRVVLLDRERARAAPSFSIRPDPTAMTFPSFGFSFAVSGFMIPPFVFPSALMPLHQDLVADLGLSLRCCYLISPFGQDTGLLPSLSPHLNHGRLFLNIRGVPPSTLFLSRNAFGGPLRRCAAAPPLRTASR